MGTHSLVTVMLEDVVLKARLTEQRQLPAVGETV